MALQRYMGIFSSPSAPAPATPMPIPMDTLPDEVVIRILSELTFKQVMNGLTVCKRFGLLSLGDVGV